MQLDDKRLEGRGGWANRKRTTGSSSSKSTKHISLDGRGIIITMYDRQLIRPSFLLVMYSIHTYLQLSSATVQSLHVQKCTLG